jgi:hypothetical protein
LEVGDSRSDKLPGLIEPISSLGSGTVGAVSITTGVVDRFLIAARLAAILPQEDFNSWIIPSWNSRISSGPETESEIGQLERKS